MQLKIKRVLYDYHNYYLPFMALISKMHCNSDIQEFWNS